MKIVYLISDITKVGGREKIVLRKANSLAKLGFSVSIVSYFSSSNRLTETENLKFYSIGINSSNRSGFNLIRHISNKFVFKRELEDLLCKIQPDILITMVEDYIDETQKICLRKGIRSILELHGSFDYYRGIIKSGYIKDLIKTIIRYVNFRLLKSTMKRFDFVILLSSIDSKKWGLVNSFVIPNYFESSEVNAKFNSDSSRFLSAGRLTKEKGFDILIESWGRLKQQGVNYHLDIYGDGPQYEKLVNKIDQLNLNENVCIKPFTDDFVSIIPSYSCFVLASRYEAFPMVILESVSNGLPIISFNLECGIRDMVIDNFNGYLVQPFDTEKLAERVISLGANQELRQHFSAKSLDIAKKFHHDNVISLWLKLFELIPSK
ncbi:glycosyltransferase [Enterovibrio norvegicus]|uniref:glycosyltransferase n=1 Tax=Enterovibrio norvegicus TaxID=188144 RepID=UPI0038999A3D